MSRLEELIESIGSDKFEGRGYDPIPSPMDDEVREFVHLYRDADPNLWPTILSSLKAMHGWVCRSVAERMAALAVRTHDHSCLEDGLLALTMAARLLYHREVYRVISLFVHSAKKLGFDPAELSQMAPEFRKWIDTFLQLDEKNQAIARWKYEESRDQDGLVYEDTLGR
jgi:hypothetical protein